MPSSTSTQRDASRLGAPSKNDAHRANGQPTRSRSRGAPSGWRTAAASDRHELYELAVQEPDAECDLIDQAWTEQRGRKCRHIREDFCGTAAVSMAWVKRRKRNTAIGVDLDTEVLAWARRKAPQRLSAEQRQRFRLLQEDVRSVQIEPVESILAMNFSYSIFRKRDELRRYFEHVHSGLTDDGMLLLDAFGGGDAVLEMEEERHLDGFTYVWDQHHYNPITGRSVNHIHFRFPDGSEMRKAFTYEWRLWTLPELRELLSEAGFRRVSVYWEGTDDETGEGDGEWSVSRRGEACEGWIAYLAAEK